MIITDIRRTEELPVFKGFMHELWYRTYKLGRLIGNYKPISVDFTTSEYTADWDWSNGLRTDGWNSEIEEKETGELNDSAADAYAEVERENVRAIWQ